MHEQPPQNEVPNEEARPHMDWTDETKVKNFIKTFLELELQRIYKSPLKFTPEGVISGLESHLVKDCDYPEEISISITDTDPEGRYTIKVAGRYPLNHGPFIIEGIK